MTPTDTDNTGSESQKEQSEKMAPMPSILGRNIEAQRRRIGINQRELSRASDVSQASISRLEGGMVQQIRSESLRKIAKVLRLPVEKLWVDPQTGESQPEYSLLEAWGLPDEQALLPAERKLICAAWEALMQPMAALNEQGVIVVANHAWRAAAGLYGLDMSKSVIGQNYLEACKHGDSSRLSCRSELAPAVRSVLGGMRMEALVNTACGAECAIGSMLLGGQKAKVQCMFRALRVEVEGKRYVVLTHFQLSVSAGQEQSTT